MSETRGPVMLRASDHGSLAVAAAALAAGGIVGIPTETVYGIGVIPRSEALQALLAAKQRSADKGIALLIDDLDQVADLVVVGAVARRLAERFWPGPLTLVLPLRQTAMAPEELTGGHDRLALRIPDHAVPRALARELGPLAVSSANRSGEPDARTAETLVASLGRSLAVVIDDGPVRGGVPSSVVAVDAAGRVAVLREGAIERPTIDAMLQEEA